MIFAIFVQAVCYVVIPGLLLVLAGFLISNYVMPFFEWLFSVPVIFYAMGIFAGVVIIGIIVFFIYCRWDEITGKKYKGKPIGNKYQHEYDPNETIDEEKIKP